MAACGENGQGISLVIGWESGRNGYKSTSAVTRSGTPITPEILKLIVEIDDSRGAGK